MKQKGEKILSRKIASIKDAQNLPVENLNAEARLKHSVKIYAEKIGLDVGIAGKITSCLVEHSKVVQRKAIYERRIKRNLSNSRIQSISVVGAGRMGCWFASYFKQFGIKITIFDKKRSVARKQADLLGVEFANSIGEILQSDIAIVSVPIGETYSVITSILSNANDSRCRAIIEVSSIKNNLSRKLARKEKQTIPVISIHPLFGGSAVSLDRNSIVFIRDSWSNNKEGQTDLALISTLFPHYSIAVMSSLEHDELMALLLTLPHMLLMGFGRIVADSKFLPVLESEEN